MRMPSYAALSSFAFSLILTSALVPSTGDVALAAAGAPAAQLAAHAILNGLRTQSGFAGGVELDLPAPVATPAAYSSIPLDASSPLTPDVMEKIVKLTQLKGADRDFPAQLANALGLSAAGQPWACRSVALKDATAMRGFAISRASEQDIVITKSAGNSFYGYRAHRDGKVSAAFIGEISTHQITMRDPAEAQKDLDAELALWASAAADPVTAK